MSLDGYLDDFPQPFSNNCSKKELYALFKKYLSDTQGLKDCDNWDIEYLEMYKNEHAVLNEIFNTFTTFIKEFVGEDYYKG